ncbi:hypothetical protein cypCar_00041626 [Cyprinus carpio]|nr:hypothetical protein cypCar_00041626 [Cyprinus carpio]
MFLMQESTTAPLYPGQMGTCSVLVVVLYCRWPVLLFGKPLYLYWLHRGGKSLGVHRVCLCSCVCMCSYLISVHSWSVWSYWFILNN